MNQIKSQTASSPCLEIKISITTDHFNSITLLKLKEILGHYEMLNHYSVIWAFKFIAHKI